MKVASFCLTALLLSGCGEGETEQPGLSPNAALCAAECSTYERCEGASADCAAACQDESRAYFQRITPTALSREAECLRGTDACPEPLSDVFENCFVTAGQSLDGSAAARRFCTNMGQTFFECAWFESASSCTQEHARYTEQALSAGEVCRGTPCEALQECMDANLWSYGAP
jgi:hypothetical protein